MHSLLYLQMDWGIVLFSSPDPTLVHNKRVSFCGALEGYQTDIIVGRSPSSAVKVGSSNSSGFQHVATACNKWVSDNSRERPTAPTIRVGSGEDENHIIIHILLCQFYDTVKLCWRLAKSWFFVAIFGSFRPKKFGRFFCQICFRVF